MTHRIYYTDAMCRAFEANVLSCAPRGDRFEVLLDRTAFYPTSGGQPFDTGRLGDRDVLDVVDREDGAIGHMVSGPLEAGARVSGTIDWARRFDHMQQHTGQHVLSAAFDRVAQARTVSFHLGSDSATIDLASDVSAADVARAADAANAAIWENRPVTIRFAGAADAAALPLRKPSERAGELRLVDIADFDLSACGGTHVPATGMIGVIAIAGWERWKGGSRVDFLCGARALRAWNRLRGVTAASTRMLSVGEAELPAAIERLQQEARFAAKAVQRLDEELSVHRAAALLAEAETIHGWSVVLTQQQDGDAAALKRLAAALVARPGVIALVCGSGHPVPIVAARSADVGFDVGAWVKGAIGRLGGRGGGREALAQGGLTAASEMVMGDFRTTLVKVAPETG
jgi:alanyl-tRNA synthetase